MTSRIGTRHLPIDSDRQKVFLDQLAKGASLVAAAKAASPHCIGHDGGLGGFTALAQRDPEFAAAIEQAHLAALGDVEDEIRRRAMEPPTRPVWHKGELVGSYEDRNSSDRMLVRLAEKLDPENWSPQSRIKSEVDITIRGAMLAIKPQDVLLLDRGEQNTFIQMLGKIADRRGESETARELAPELLVSSDRTGSDGGA